MAPVVMMDSPDGKVIGRGSYYGGPDYEFVVADDGPVYFKVVADAIRFWACPDAASFRRIAVAWNRYRSEVRGLPSEAAQMQQVAEVRADPGLN